MSAFCTVRRARVYDARMSRVPWLFFVAAVAASSPASGCAAPPSAAPPPAKEPAAAPAGPLAAQVAEGRALVLAYDAQISETLDAPAAVELLVLGRDEKTTDRLHGHPILVRRMLPPEKLERARAAFYASLVRGPFVKATCPDAPFALVVRGALVLEILVCEAPPAIDVFRARAPDFAMDPSRGRAFAAEVRALAAE